MGNVMFMRKGEVHTAPVGGLPISSLVEGQIVMINEGGTPVPFYLAKHDYESGLNGAGRVLLVRKDCYDKRTFNSANNNIYANSAMDTWLNGDYKSLLDSNIQEAMGTTQFYYCAGNNSTTVTTLARSVFLLSITELALSDSNAVACGTTLPTADTLKIAYMNGTAVEQWTRTVRTNYDSGVFYVNTSGATTWQYFVTGNSYGSRPCFTLPSDMLTEVSDDGTVTLKVA